MQLGCNGAVVCGQATAACFLSGNPVSVHGSSFVIARIVSLSVRRSSRWVPNSGSFAVPRDVSIVAAADLPHQSTTCIIEVVQKDASKSESQPKVQHADGQPLRISVSKSSDVRTCLAQALQLAAQFKANASIALSFGDQPVSDSDATTAAEVVTVHAYSPSTWKKVVAHQRSVVQSCAILGASAHAVQRGSEVGTAINMARRLGDLPPNVATPAYMASHAIQLCDPSHSAPAALTCTVLDEKDCANLGMNLLLAVGSGSSNPPRIIALEHCPPGLEASQPVLLVGKGVTFDSGGISIKPSAKMEEMKWDMCGAATGCMYSHNLVLLPNTCAVMGTLSLVSRIQMPLRVVGVLACAENMPSGSAYRPSDVYRGFNGVSVEIINTDAEGRLCLADALAWACNKYNPRSTIDLATLTGAIGVALGSTRAGLFCKDKQLSSAILAAARASGEKVWPMPMDIEYDHAISAGIADIKNQAAAGTGVSTSAMFLTHFVTGPHAHLDIASMAWSTALRSPFSTTGATGWGVRLLYEYLRELSQPAGSSSSSVADPPTSEIF